MHAYYLLKTDPVLKSVMMTRATKSLVAALWLSFATGALGFVHHGGVSHPRPRITLQMKQGAEVDTSLGQTRRNAIERGFASTAILLGIESIVGVGPSNARLDPVNRPDLLPNESGLNVIQIEKFLTTGQAKRMDSLLTSVERDSGFRVRVLCQAYPQTPGLAIRDYWDVSKEVSARCGVQVYMITS
jgi:hypothetical protein